MSAGVRHYLLGFMRGQREETIGRALTALREIADETVLGAVVDQFKKELVETFPLDGSGQVMDYDQLVSVELGDYLGPRRGIIYQLDVHGDSVQLNYGARSIVFPSFFQEALHFSLTTPAFVVRDLPGELRDKERVAFIDRLIKEGLLVRMPVGEDQAFSAEKRNAALLEND